VSATRQAVLLGLVLLASGAYCRGANTPQLQRPAMDCIVSEALGMSDQLDQLRMAAPKIASLPEAAAVVWRHLPHSMRQSALEAAKASSGRMGKLAEVSLSERVEAEAVVEIFANALRAAAQDRCKHGVGSNGLVDGAALDAKVFGEIEAAISAIASASGVRQPNSAALDLQIARLGFPNRSNVIYLLIAFEARRESGGAETLGVFTSWR
jgi:hypothetical protein